VVRESLGKGQGKVMENEGPGRGNGEFNNEEPGRADGEANNEGRGRGQATPQEGPGMTNDRPCRKWFPLLGIGHETENEDCAVWNVQTM
jgi:hypothetical protein